MDRLEELKMQNMKKVIEAIRVEVAQYWDRCFYSQEQRQAFAAYYSGSYRSVALHVAAHLCFTCRHSLGSISSGTEAYISKPFSINCHSCSNKHLQMLLGNEGSLKQHNSVDCL